jgi:transglutaminase-like putative cysteine protease
MDRRTFLKAATALPVGAALSRLCGAAALASARHEPFDPQPGTWRTYEITTRVETLAPAGVTRVWLPVPGFASDFQRPLGDTWSGNARIMQRMGEGPHAARMLYAEFAAGEKRPVVELTSRVETQSRAVAWSRKTAADASADAVAAWTRPTALMPTDGIVRDAAVAITRGKATDLDKVKAVYDWILANTYREPAVRGCGVGDIRAMLESKNLGGKCGDINGLFVGLVRAAGVPARDLYGIRVGPSAFGYRTLGAAGADITKGQHCRAEVLLADYGWVAMDPADVGKVAREETEEWLKIDDPIVAPVRFRLFGGWEGNWIAFNAAHDVALPNATQGGTLGFFMYPQAETAHGRRDSLSPDTFKYTITARQI